MVVNSNSVACLKRTSLPEGERDLMLFEGVAPACVNIDLGEAADLLFLGVHQPAHTILLLMAINKWAVLFWHDATMAKPQHQLLLAGLQRLSTTSRMRTRSLVFIAAI